MRRFQAAPLRSACRCYCRRRALRSSKGRGIWGRLRMQTRSMRLLCGILARRIPRLESILGTEFASGPSFRVLLPGAFAELRRPCGVVTANVAAASIVTKGGCADVLAKSSAHVRKE